MNELIKYIQEAVNMSVVKSKLNQPYKKSKQHERTLVYEKAFSHNKSSVTTTLPFPPVRLEFPPGIQISAEREEQLGAKPTCIKEKKTNYNY